MKIYNSLGVEIIDVPVADSSYRYRSLQEISALTLYFRHIDFVEIPVGSYCEFQGETYSLEDPVNFKKHGSRNFEYTLTLESAWARSRRYKIRNIVDGRLKFNLTATPEDHLQLVVDNMNLRDAGWSVGECIEGAEKLISYSHIYCKDALSMIADEFDSEWEVSGKVISLKRVEYNKEAPLELSYGRGNGFKPGVGRMNYNDSKPVEVLYVQGGGRNIDFSKYGSHELLLPKSKQLVYEGRTYETDADGLSVTRSDKPVLLHNEDSLDLSHIYPSRVGSVSSVEVIDAGDHFYDILDNSIPVDLDYSQYRTAGEKATIIFQSGILSGREFDIEQTDTALTGYIHAQRRFKIVPQEIDGQTMPNETFTPAAGDKYAVFGIQLPDAYICDDVTESGASWDMFREAVKYLYENEDPKFSFTGELDGIWAKQNWLAIGGKIKVGGYVSFSDTQFEPVGVLIRIIGIKDLVNNPYFPVLELSNSPSGRSIVNDIRKIEANEVVTEQLHKESLSFTKRRFRDARETMKMLESAFSNFSGSVNPITVQTMALLVGDESLQFRFVDDMVTPATVPHLVTFNAGTKILASPSGIIQHMTIGIVTISAAHTADEYEFWNMSLYESPALMDGAKSYYLYAKVSKTEQTGVFLLSEAAIGMEDVAGYYHLLVGILNSENEDGDRSYVDMYGYSEVLPGRITTDRIVSTDGETYFDLAQSEIGGKITFKAGSSGYNQLADKPDLSGFALEADVDAITANLQMQIDGQITTYFEEYVPSLVNAPASGWGSDVIRDVHLGDLFYNKATGLGYRFSKTGVVYSWELLKDTDVALALANAATAQDTADGKRRVFTAQPVPPYDLGDLWSQGTAGDLMKCITARAAGGYNAADWEKASKYTDDTAANNIQVGGRNLYLINGTIDHWSIGGEGNVTRNYTTGYKNTPATRLQTLGSYHFRFQFPIITAASEMTLTFWYKCLGISYALRPQINDMAFDSVIDGYTPSWTKYSATKYIDYYIGVHGFIDFEFYSSSDILISDIKLEIGNRATDWTPAPEDIEARIAASDYLKEAIKNNTTIQGGLLSTTIMRLGAVNQAGTWVEKAGINGAAGSENTPRFYGGGSLADAIARVAGNPAGAKFVVTEGGKVFAIDVQLAGSFKTAATGARIEIDQPSGSVIIYDANNAPKTIITSGAIPSIEALLANSSSSIDASVSAAAVVITEGTDNETQYSAILTLPASGSNYTVETPPITCNCEASDSGEGGEETARGAGSVVSAYLVKPDDSEIFLGSLSAFVSGDAGDNYDSQYAVIPSQQFAGLPAGNYKIKLYAQSYAASIYASSNCSIAVTAPNNVLSGESVVSVSRIYRDGMFLVTDASNYLYEAPTMSELKKEGPRKGFGIITAAYCAANGTIAHKYNAIIVSTSNNGSGLFTITHNLGHINYLPIVNPVGSGNVTASVVNISANTCQVQLRSGWTGTNMDFVLQLVGS